MQTNELLEVIYLGQLLLELLPLALDDCHGHILVNRAQEVAHLLPQEL